MGASTTESMFSLGLADFNGNLEDEPLETRRASTMLLRKPSSGIQLRRRSSGINAILEDGLGTTGPLPVCTGPEILTGSQIRNSYDAVPAHMTATPTPSMPSRNHSSFRLTNILYRQMQDEEYPTSFSSNGNDSPALFSRAFFESVQQQVVKLKKEQSSTVRFNPTPESAKFPEQEPKSRSKPSNIGISRSRTGGTQTGTTTFIPHKAEIRSEALQPNEDEWNGNFHVDTSKAEPPPGEPKKDNRNEDNSQESGAAEGEIQMNEDSVKSEHTEEEAGEIATKEESSEESLITFALNQALDATGESVSTLFSIVTNIVPSDGKPLLTDEEMDANENEPAVSLMRSVGVPKETRHYIYQEACDEIEILKDVSTGTINTLTKIFEWAVGFSAGDEKDKHTRKAICALSSGPKANINNKPDIWLKLQKKLDEENKAREEEKASLEAKRLAETSLHVESEDKEESVTSTASDISLGSVSVGFKNPYSVREPLSTRDSLSCILEEDEIASNSGTGEKQASLSKCHLAPPQSAKSDNNGNQTEFQNQSYAEQFKQKDMKEQTHFDSPPIQRTVREFDNPPIQRTVRVVDNPPIQRTVRELENPPPIQRTVRVFENPPIQQTLRIVDNQPRIIDNQPTQRTVRVLDKLPFQRTVRAVDNLPTQRTVRAVDNPSIQRPVRVKNADKPPIYPSGNKASPNVIQKPPPRPPAYSAARISLQNYLKGDDDEPQDQLTKERSQSQIDHSTTQRSVRSPQEPNTSHLTHPHSATNDDNNGHPTELQNQSYADQFQQQRMKEQSNFGNPSIQRYADKPPTYPSGYKASPYVIQRPFSAPPGPGYSAARISLQKYLKGDDDDEPQDQLTNEKSQTQNDYSPPTHRSVRNPQKPVANHSGNKISPTAILKPPSAHTDINGNRISILNRSKIDKTQQQRMRDRSHRHHHSPPIQRNIRPANNQNSYQVNPNLFRSKIRNVGAVDNDNPSDTSTASTLKSWTST